VIKEPQYDVSKEKIKVVESDAKVDMNKEPLYEN